MEQKQLDELDESYFGEEFVDEELLTGVSKSKAKSKTQDDDIKIEPLAAEAKAKKKSSVKKAAKQAKIEPALMEPAARKTESAESVKAEAAVFKTASEAAESKAEAEQSKVEIFNEASSAKAEASSEPQKLFNPFASEDNQKKDPSSTWKAVTGIAIVLLIFSIFTQGFNFKGDGLTGAAAVKKELPLEDVEWRVLRYVNENLLEPPFMATVESSSEAGPLYRLVLAVGGEQVTSYVTKDGRLFFPQALDISYFLTVEEVDPKKEGKSREEGLNAEDKAAEVRAGGSSDDAAPETSPQSSLKLTAKKWLFSPQQVTVKEGQMVALMIEPENLGFTFVIPEFGVEKEISGPTRVEFKATKKGSFPFSCSSCEEWRGMTGTLVVE